MKLFLKFCLIPIVLFSLHGCIEFKTLITVNRDGSGTIEETFLLSKEVTKMIAEFASSFQTDSAEEKKDFDLFDEEKLKLDANKYGEGTMYISGEKIINEEREGFKAVYSFSDINKLTVNQNPNDQIPLEMTEDEAETEDNLTFTFIKGNPSEIIINMPPFEDTEDSVDVSDQNEVQENATGETEAESDSISEEFINMLKDLNMSLKIHIEGSITETDAMYIDGSDVTLFDISFKNLLDNKEKFTMLKDLNPSNLKQAMEIIKNIEGIKVEMNKQVKIKFN
jgi:hypothetical protein